MISILVPTRGRPENMKRLVESGRETASGPIEFVFYIDDGDYVSEDMAAELHVQRLVGDRIVLSEMWNRCSEIAQHDVMMHCGDDIVFRTPEWDTKVLETFEQFPDRIALVYGRDGIQDKGMATHGFLHRNWVNALGYFVPPYFSSDYNDLWNHQVAEKIGRLMYVPEIYTEHMHPVAGKGPLDLTHQERLQRHTEDDVDSLYLRLAPEREADAEKLRRAMRGEI